MLGLTLGVVQSVDLDKCVLTGILPLVTCRVFSLPNNMSVSPIHLSLALTPANSLTFLLAL